MRFPTHIYFSLLLLLFLSSFLSVARCREFHVGSYGCRSGGNSRAPIADSMKVRITCASAPIRLRSWNNRLQRALRPLCSLRWNFCWRYVTGLVKKKSVRQNFSTYPRRSISYIYSAAAAPTCAPLEVRAFKFML